MASLDKKVQKFLSNVATLHAIDTSQWLLNNYKTTQTKSPPRTNVGAGLIFSYTARGTTLLES